MNNPGMALNPTANTHASTAANPAEYTTTFVPTDRATEIAPAPSADPTNDCAAMANASNTSDKNDQSCSNIWCAASDDAPKRAATDAADTNATWNDRERMIRSLPKTSCLRMILKCGAYPPWCAFPNAQRNNSAVMDSPTRFATADPTSPYLCTSSGTNAALGTTPASVK